MFAELERRIADKRAAGIDVISLGIGDPDEPTYPHIVEAMQEAVAEPGNQQYPSNRGRDEFREAFADFYDEPLRRRDRPRERGDPGDRRQGVHLQPLLRLPRPGRRRARLRPRLPGLHRRPDPRRRHARAAAAGARAGLRPRPRRGPRRRRRQGAADVPQLPQQPDRRGRPRGLLRDASSPSPASTRSSSSTTTPTRRRPTTATSRRASSRRPAPRRSGSRSSRSPRATT